MNKSELCARLADETGLTLDEAIKVVETFFSTIRHALMKGDRVEIRGFCSWHIKEYQGYAGRNPNTGKIVDLYASLGCYCKEVSGGLPTMISPYIDGSKNVSQYNASTSKENVVTLESHEREWDAIFAGIQGAVDIVAFQDGHVEYDELVDFLKVNKKLADRYGLECWTNSETFDRDMPIKFLPIKWEKLRLKMGLAAQAGYRNAITFEFSHFMSPQSAYLQAGHLYDRYMEYLKTLE